MLKKEFTAPEINREITHINIFKIENGYVFADLVKKYVDDEENKEITQVVVSQTFYPIDDCPIPLTEEEINELSGTGEVLP